MKGQRGMGAKGTWARRIMSQFEILNGDAAAALTGAATSISAIEILDAQAHNPLSLC